MLVTFQASPSIPLILSLHFGSKVYDGEQEFEVSLFFLFFIWYSTCVLIIEYYEMN